MIDLIGQNLDRQLQLWLEEDIGTGDVTTMSTIPSGHQSKGIIHLKEEYGVIAGIPVAAAVFRILDKQLKFTAVVAEGHHAKKGSVIAEVEGSTRSILLGERLALNLLQRLSGIATRTREMADKMKDLPVRLVDTRKTTPGHRLLEKYAVRVGGGYNHRFGLYDAVMIKDNHIKGAGGLREAVHSARKQIPHTMKIEVEVENRMQLMEALEAKADIIMLDNMNLADMKESVAAIRRLAPHVIIEASGNVSLETVRGIAETGVDVISAGRLTYSVPSLDISLDLNEQKGGSL